jgi:hypothetical protein
VTTQPEALRLADRLTDFAKQDRLQHGYSWELLDAAAELRRLHTVNAELLGLLKALMDTRHKHFIDNGIDGMHGWDEQAQTAIARAEEVKP